MVRKKKSERLSSRLPWWRSCSTRARAGMRTVVELNEGLAVEEAGGDGAGFALVHGEEALVEEGFGGEFGVGA
jgi:hypothetical protein